MVRQTLERAGQLLQNAHGLAAQADVAVNRITELERAWQVLDAAAIAPTQQAEFSALMAQLATRLRERADAEARHKRWQVEAAAALAPLEAACTDAAAGTLDRTGLGAAIGAAQALGLTLRSLVFPRNQFNPAYLGICRRLGILAYRGVEAAWPSTPCAI